MAAEEEEEEGGEKGEMACNSHSSRSVRRTRLHFLPWSTRSSGSQRTLRIAQVGRLALSHHASDSLRSAAKSGKKGSSGVSGDPGAQWGTSPTSQASQSREEGLRQFCILSSAIGLPSPSSAAPTCFAATMTSRPKSKWSRTLFRFFWKLDRPSQNCAPRTFYVATQRPRCSPRNSRSHAQWREICLTPSSNKGPRRHSSQRRGCSFCETLQVHHRCVRRTGMAHRAGAQHSWSQAPLARPACPGATRAGGPGAGVTSPTTTRCHTTRAAAAAVAAVTSVGLALEWALWRRTRGWRSRGPRRGGSCGPCPTSQTIIQQPPVYRASPGEFGRSPGDPQNWRRASRSSSSVVRCGQTAPPRPQPTAAMVSGRGRMWGR
mmetsp:Transcript_44156/g.102058  ORF Transcript_44156/g.102058 Transcript_44156/m.102058 type:complete len:376 (-) Transcript_44156:233-1360(-)